MGLGLMQYAQDYDETLPIYRAGAIGSETYSGWMYSIQPYVKSYQIFRCPSDTNTNLPGPPVLTTTPPTGTNNSSYASNTNNRFGTPANAAGPLANAIPLAAISSVATTLMVADGTAQVVDAPGINAGVYNSAATPRTLYWGGFANGYVERHLETINTLWCDGHVKAVKLSLLATPASGPNAVANTHTFLTCYEDPS